MPKQYPKQYLILFDSVATATHCDFISVIPLYIVVLDDLNARLGVAPISKIGVNIVRFLQNRH